MSSANPTPTHLSFEQQESLCPFHFVLDEQQNFVQVSDRLKKYWGLVAPSTSFHDLIEITRPFMSHELGELRDLFGFEVHLNLKSDQARGLRGQVLRHGEGLLFVGNPRLHSTKELATLGLSLGDFALHEGMADLLIAVETAQASLINAQKLADKLRLEGKKTNSVLESLVEILFVLGPDGNILRANGAASSSLGISRAELESRHIDQLLIDESIFQEMLHEIEEDEAHLVENLRVRLRGPGQTQIPALLNAARIADGQQDGGSIVCVIRDQRQTLRLLSDAQSAAQAALQRANELQAAHEKLRQSQSQLVHAGQLAAVGELAVSLAHELNQPLTGVMMLSNTEVPETTDPEKIRNNLSVIHQESARMRDIVSTVLNFSRPQSGAAKPVNINDVLGAVKRLVGKQLELQNVTIQSSAVEDFPDVMGNASGLQQVFLNLITNARDAILESGEGGEIEISASPDASASHFAILFTDTGVDVPAELETQLFQPFITSKDKGAGTGLGLSIIRGIVERMGGSIYFSRTRNGTKQFVLSLPRADSGNAHPVH